MIGESDNEDLTLRRIPREQLELPQPLREIVRVMQGSAKLPEVLRSMTEHVGQTLGVSRCLILVNPAANLPGLYEWAAPGLKPVSSLPFGSIPYVLQMGDSREPLAISDITAGMELLPVLDGSSTVADALREWGVCAVLNVPIRIEERLLGNLVLHQCEAPRQWDGNEIHFCEMVAGQLAAAIRYLEMQGQDEQLRIAEKLIHVTEAERTRLVQILESTPDFVLTTDRKGLPVYANRAALELFGWDPELFGEKGIIEQIFPEWAVHVIRTIGIPTAIRSGVWQGAVEMLGREQKMIPVSIVIIAHKNPEEPLERDGSRRQVSWFSLIARDITEQQRTEESLRLAESRFSRIIEIAADAMIAVDEKQRITIFNKAAEQMFGYSAIEIYGKLFHTLLPERYADLYASFIGSLHDPFNGGRRTGNEREIYGKRRTGEEFPAEISISRLAVAGGTLYIAILRDVTEQKRAKEQLERLSRDLELILNSAGEGIFGTDCDGHMTFINPAAVQMLGWQENELVGRSIDDVVRRPGERRSCAVDDCPICQVLRTGQARRSSGELFWRKDGTSFPVEYVSTPIYRQGQFWGVVVTFTDITEREAVERLKDQFLSIVSHELRTPLTAIAGALELLSEKVLGPLPERAERMIDIAVKNTDRLVRLINDILDVERLRFGKVSMVMHKCRVADLMQGALDATLAMAASTQVSLSVQPSPYWVWADPDRIIQTLTNLISNAVKFSPPHATIQVEATADAKQVCICVADQGRGIPADKLEVIFQPFKQVDASDARQKGGTGLGLAICHSIVLQHGGRIWVESELGVGSRFYFTLPRIEPDEAAV